MAETSKESILTRFRPQVATWFQDVFKEPTSVQRQAWEAISTGEHALVVAPTGSGKTLAAFLWAINGLLAPEGQTALHLSPLETRTSQLSGGTVQRAKNKGVRVLYISPLKALGVDVERNLRAPLIGISQVAARLGLDQSEISIGVRSGDTTAAERTKLTKNPPDILITTPESAYLMLTSKAALSLQNVETVIIDEIHALAGTKRGVHLALTLERLEALVGHPVQRIGLSATVRPIDVVAKFLGGDRPVEIIHPPAEKRWDLSIHVCVPDMSDLPTPEPGSTIGEATIDDPLGLSSPLSADSEVVSGEAVSGGASPDTTLSGSHSSIWPSIEQDVYQQIMAHRSTLVFVNSRRSAERLSSRLNELYALEHDPDSLAPPLRRPPASLGLPVDVAGSAPTVIARAHHGSVSKDERATIEALLKEGSLKSVIATSSLELGIDMGAVDLVIQVESPPTVASGLQRVGRAGHVVGAISRGRCYPKHRSDLVQAAVTQQRMLSGEIEALTVPANALDVLVQQTVAMVAVRDIHVDEWYELIRRAYPYRDLPREVYQSVIDLTSGVYPSTDFAQLRPRVNFDRITGMLSSRPGTQRAAVIGAGTIPDRGMFGVYLVGGQQGARRVGELDEEMVYESRVGDVFTLGASSWRIEEITRDQVLVSPAPGHTGRLPFWHGDGPGRPAELGRAIGAFRRHAHQDPSILEGLGLADYSEDNLLAFLREQHEATGIIPDEQTLVLERFQDELGDWRVILHTPYGRGVNAAWALAVGARISERTGIDAQPVAGDDGIILRLPEGEVEPNKDLFFFEPDEITDLVTAQVGNSALFASRFRECAARALLLPSKPGRRAPLWQQRQRAAQLLDIARKYPSFPIVLETVRECLQDVYDLPTLSQLCQDLTQRQVRIVEVTTQTPSPFASSLLFNYTGAFMYEGDTPLAEKRAAALALDPALLAKLLGRIELRDLLDPEVIAETHARLQRLVPERQARNSEEVVDLLRVLGPVPSAELGAHLSPALLTSLTDDEARSTDFTDDAPLSFDDAELEQQEKRIDGEAYQHIDPPALVSRLCSLLEHRIMQVRIAGRDHVALAQDAALLRDGLGVPVPAGIGASTELVPDALHQLVVRWARARGPFVRSDLQHAFGLAAGVAHAQLSALIADNVLLSGQFRKGIEEEEYVAPEVLKLLRSRSLAIVRAHTHPVSESAYGRFLPQWHHISAIGQRAELSGADGVYAVCEQLAGVRLPASAWETFIFPQRVQAYQPSMLDELTSQGDIIVVGAGSAGSNDPWVRLLPADYAPELLEASTIELSAFEEQILRVISTGGGFLFKDVQHLVSGEGLELSSVHATERELRQAMWSLFEQGRIIPDSFNPLRSLLSAGKGGKTAHRATRTPRRSRLGRGRTSHHTPFDMVGRWSLTPQPEHDATTRSLILGETWLDRYGVVTRGSVLAEDVTGGFALAYTTLSSFEESGKALRGYIIEGLGAAQFSTPGVIDQLRGLNDTDDVEGWPYAQEPAIHVLAACDPANPYGASLPWPRSGCSRSAGALVVLIDGLLMAYLTRGGRNLTLFDPPTGITADKIATMVAEALKSAVSAQWMTPLLIEQINGDPAFEHPLLPSLRAAGAALTPRGIRITGHTPIPTQAAGGRSLSQALEDAERPVRQPTMRRGPFRR